MDAFVLHFELQLQPDSSNEFIFYMQLPSNPMKERQHQTRCCYSAAGCALQLRV